MIRFNKLNEYDEEELHRICVENNRFKDILIDMKYRFNSDNDKEIINKEYDNIQLENSFIINVLILKTISKEEFIKEFYND